MVHETIAGLNGINEQVVQAPPTDAGAGSDPYGLNDKTHLKDRRDILLTASEYFLGVVTLGELESDDDYEYRDLDDLQPLIEDGVLELQRHEIRVSGETVDIYMLTDKGWAEIKNMADESDRTGVINPPKLNSETQQPEAAPAPKDWRNEYRLVLQRGLNHLETQGDKKLVNIQAWLDAELFGLKKDSWLELHGVEMCSYDDPTENDSVHTIARAVFARMLTNEVGSYMFPRGLSDLHKNHDVVGGFYGDILDSVIAGLAGCDIDELHMAASLGSVR